MAENITIYLGRDNKEIFELRQDGVVVTADAVTRAVLQFGDFCLDTDYDEEIELTTDSQRVEIAAGTIDGLAQGIYPGTLTVFDLMSADNGFAWESFNVHVKDWPASIAVRLTGAQSTADALSTAGTMLPEVP